MRRLCIKLIEWYQRKTVNSSKRCRFYPSCSNYGLECYKRFNFFKASFLTLYRLIRCNPWCKGGYDPVPEKKSKLIKLCEDVYILEHKENTDRPNLGYIYKENGSYIIDGGNSKKHLKRFYKLLKRNKLPLPKYSIITHHHWDHTLGLYYTNTISYGLKETNELLKRHKESIEEKGIKYLIKEKEIPAFCKDHIYLEYKRKLNSIKIKLIDKIIEEKLTIDNLEIFKFPSNHSCDNLTVLDKKNGILFLGDTLCGKIVEFDFIKDINILKEQLNVISNLDFNIAVEAHQLPTNKEDLIVKLQTKVEELIKKG